MVCVCATFPNELFILSSTSLILFPTSSLTHIWDAEFQERPTMTLHPCEILSSLTVGSVQFSHSVVSNSLQPHELQHARPPCPSPTPGVHSDSSPSSR